MKICLIKLGADGDVLRTLPLARALHDDFPEAEITCVTKGDVAALLEELEYVQRIVQLADSAQLEKEEFDALYTFDTEKEALELAGKIIAKKRYGFYDNAGYPAAYNAGGEYYLNTMFDDELKKTNKKTYQEIMFEVAELPFRKERCELILREEDKKYAREFVLGNSLKGKKIIGVHMGAGARWPSKAWHPERVKEFIVLAKAKGYEIILFGGPNEIQRHEQLAEELRKEGMTIYRNNPKNTKREFAALVNVCDYFVCADSFALHVALGLGKRTVALFFVTSPAEVETYELGKKVISPRLYEFFPERSDVYDEELVKSISAEEVMTVVEAI